MMMVFVFIITKVGKNVAGQLTLEWSPTIYCVLRLYTKNKYVHLIARVLVKIIIGIEIVE